jgi:hypothetical protein
MLPPGHIAGGYLTAYALVKLTGSQLTAHQQNFILAMGAFWGFAPDLDMFIGFFRHRHLTVLPNGLNHRYLPTHAPLNWLIAGLAVIVLIPDTFGRYLGLTIWLGSWSHFLLDSFGYGIMWLWPLSKKVYSFKSVGIDYHNTEPNFFKYWIKFLLHYTYRLPFYLELIVIVSAVIVYFHH